MTPSLLSQWIAHPETLDRDSLYELRTQVARYPYFQSLRLLYLKNLYLLHDASFGAELRKAALYVADRSVLFYQIEGDRYTLKPMHQDAKVVEEGADVKDGDRTLSLIDAYLSSVPQEQAPVTGLDYAVDYAAYLLQDEDEVPQAVGAEEPPKLRGHDLIEGFLRQSEPAAGDELPETSPLVVGKNERLSEVVPEQDAEDEETELVSETSSTEVDDSCFTETLAKIYVKQHRYEKALEIIRKLSLNYPKKNAYFADQIRFLEKLIINAKTNE